MDTSSRQVYSKGILDQDDSFRLIFLGPGDADSPLTIHLLNRTLHDAPPYEAVSYVWGDTNKQALVQVEDYDGKRSTQIPITYNCHDALVNLRHTDSSRVLWIDSICIDQSSSAEKTHQLHLMAHIYRNASQVLVYLGSGTTTSDVAMRFVSELDRPPDHDHFKFGKLDWNVVQDERGPVNQLFQRSWFYRVWVLQEITFAQKAAVICGSYQVEWESFIEFYHWNLGSRWVDKLPYSVNYAAARDRYIPHMTYSDRLLKALSDTRYCGATDPRDRLYAILPVLDREHDEMRAEVQRSDISWELNEEELRQSSIRQQPLEFQLSYNNSVKQVYTDLATVLLKAVGLDLLTHVISEPSVSGLPSWVPDWTTSSPYWAARAPRVAREKPFSGFPGGPPLMIWGWKAVHPHLINTWTCSTYSQDNETSAQLHVKGVSIGKIEQLGDLCDIEKDYFPIDQWASLIPDSSLLHSQGTSTDDDPESWNSDLSLSPFATTLAMNDIVYPKAVIDVINYIRRYNGVEIGESEEDYNSFGSPSKDVKERIPLKECFAYGPSYDKQALWILKHCDGKRFMALNDGSIGLAPDRAQVGDEVFVVQGAGTPFALRPLKLQATSLNDEASGSSVEEVYSLVGEVFVLGAMGGEIWDLVDNGTKVVVNMVVR
ncbi:hypothetical protein FGRMN_10962 [Fusarium graminum]|nr:hypothetical protein FGRMN_10962 [Fusarium graminum]